MSAHEELAIFYAELRAARRFLLSKYRTACCTISWFMHGDPRFYYQVAHGIAGQQNQKRG